MKKILVCGAGGFIGGAMMKRLKNEGHWVRGVDLKEHEFFNAYDVADEFVVGDLRDPTLCDKVVTEDLDEIYQFAADMGGAGFVFTGENDADIMHNSAMINLNIAEQCVKKGVNKVFFVPPESWQGALKHGLAISTGNNLGGVSEWSTPFSRGGVKADTTENLTLPLSHRSPTPQED